MKQKFLYLLYKYKSASETDKEPLGAIIENKVGTILNLEYPYSPLLRRPNYPASSRAREVLEVQIKELMDLGVGREVGNNEQVEVSKPFIMTWNNGEQRIVWDFRALNTYTIPYRYPIPTIHETLKQFSHSEFGTAMDSLEGFYQNSFRRNYKKLLRRIFHCGIYEYLRMPFGIKIPLPIIKE
ncbi:hypothetical protein O181_032620 [Austropuccinia psidii MF-1]|uniref:Reverse transcriptase n=1 Tax=Austropuccinia psidii MF-1 TaxID=1389203 RepID=A0A9Q3D1D2_9BASI|nr:hypothetical protein [Austropuccinia psidii MF-1]